MSVRSEETNPWDLHQKKQIPMIPAEKNCKHWKLKDELPNRASNGKWKLICISMMVKDVEHLKTLTQSFVFLLLRTPCLVLDPMFDWIVWFLGVYIFSVYYILYTLTPIRGIASKHYSSHFLVIIFLQITIICCAEAM